MLHAIWLLSVLIGSILIPCSAHADKRVALIVGNSAYQHTPALKNPGNDAVDMATALKALNFNVIEAVDVDKVRLEAKIREFARALVGADVGLFFYSGHGIQVGGHNYIVPVDAKLEDGAALNFELVRLEFVQQIMEQATRTNVIFLDACRDNPLVRNLARALGTRSTQIGHGLAVMESGSGTLISFSTQPGNVALDGAGRNSPFAGALAKHIRSAGEDLSSILINVRNDVMAATKDRQVPWDHSALRAKLYFTPNVGSQLSAANFDQQAELLFWNGVKDTKSPAMLQSYLNRFPNGTFSGLAHAMIEHLNKEDVARAALAQREEELKRAELAKQATEAKRADELRKAEEIRRSEELRIAQEEVRKAQAALKAAEEQRLASLTAEQASRRAGDLVQGLRRELIRVGCDPGVAEAGWNAAAREALREFVRITRRDVPTDVPTQEALSALTGQRGRVCPLKCGSGESEVNGRCVVKAAPAKDRAVQAGQQRKPSEVRETPASGSNVGACPSLKGIAAELRGLAGC